MVARYQGKNRRDRRSAALSMGFNQTWSCSTTSCPSPRRNTAVSIPKAVRKAALDVDIPPGGTIQGYGVKFYPPGTPLSGQKRALDAGRDAKCGEHISVVWPSNIRTQDPVFPAPEIVDLTPPRAG